MICSPITEKGHHKEWLTAQMIWLLDNVPSIMLLPLTKRGEGIFFQKEKEKEKGEAIDSKSKWKRGNRT